VDIVYTSLPFGRNRKSREDVVLLLRPMATRVYLIMMRILNAWVVMCCFCAASVVSCAAQASTKNPAADVTASVQQAVNLAAKGRCREALPRLKAATARLADKQLKYQAWMSTARCAMSLDQTETAVEALLSLRREFPGDPEVLYTATHFFSELASRSSQELAAVAPGSQQAQQLEAEAFESQGKWEEASTQYKKILEQNPRAPGVHYRMGRIFLAKSPADEAGANKEFEEELKVDPQNAAAEFMLGESARQAGRWDEAISRFSKASKLDEGFVEAYLALGMSFNSAGKFSEAVSSLETYVKLQPGDPAGHYQLATAYARTGRRQEAEREMKLQQEATSKGPQRGANSQR
jgi:tetratricopeptide (TPR) repeat protein